MKNTLNMPLISIIVPVYNVEKYLEKSVHSIINQTYSNLEIILVDDGSIDESGNICDGLANTDDRIRVFHQENKGLGAARNTGINNALGKYLMFIDSDDEIETNAVELLFMQLTFHNTLVVACSLAPSHKQGMPTNKGADIKRANIECLSGIAYLLKYRHPSACCILFDNRLFKKARFKEGILLEDMQLIPRILVNIKTLVFVGNIKLYFYLVRENSIIQNFRKGSLHADVAMVAVENIDYFSKRYGENSEITENMMEYHLEQCLRYFADTRECDESFVEAFRKMVSKYCYNICKSEVMAGELREAIFTTASTPDKALIQLKWSDIFEACEKQRRYAGDKNSINLKNDTILTSIKNINEVKVVNEASVNVQALYLKFDKFKNYYHMLNQWLKLKYEGKELDLWFTKNDIKTIAIYGMGEMGNRLCDSLKHSNIKVLYAIDKAAGYSYSEVKIFEPDSQLPKVDAIIITATFAYESIKERLEKKVNYRLFSLKEVVFGID